MIPIRVLLADDHALLREGLRLLLSSQADMEVVGEAGDGVETLDLVRGLRPEVVLLDIAMPRMNGLETLKVLRSIAPETQVLILSSHENEAYIHEALLSGARGYLVKGAPSSDLLNAIRAVHAGRYYLSGKIQGQVIQGYLDGHQERPRISGFDDLSEREQQVFRLLVEGNTSNEIADLLCISSKTVDKHRASIARKIGIDNPVKMVQYAIRLGLVNPDLWGK